MPEISVIVPVYKVQQYLQQCIDSILAQTFEDFDLILVDDGSPDDCGNICDKYAEIDKRIHVIHQQNGGLSAARNAGIDWSYQHSNSKWLTFIDSDDWVNSRYLEVLYKIVKKYNATIGICAYKEIYSRVSESTNQIFQEQGREWKPEDFYLKRRVNATVAWGKFYKKELFAKKRYPVGKLHEDEFLTYQILFAQEKIGVTEEKLYYYYINPDGIMQSKSKDKKADIIEAYLQQINYFEINGFESAKKSSVRAYIGVLCAWINEWTNTQKLRKDEIKFQKQLLGELKKALKQFQKQAPFNECRWAYEVAYPRQVRCYNFAEQAVNKVKRIWQKLVL